MYKTLLIHQDKIQHYRVPVYNYLHDFLFKNNFYFKVASEGIQEEKKNNVSFPLIELPLNFFNLTKLVSREKPAILILWINHSRKYFFPFLIYLRLTGKKVVTWTHGIDLQRKHSKLSAALHYFEHSLCNGIILYAQHLTSFLTKKQQQKAFIANNTLNLSIYDNNKSNREKTLKKHNISTSKNIIFTGRIQKRKRVDDLIKAFCRITINDIGLILVGPDEDGFMTNYPAECPNIFFLGPVYSDELIDLLKACDIYCIPGAVGLSIVDAQYCGLPVVTEDVEHGPEIMYLKNGQNGYITAKGDIAALANHLQILLTNDALRNKFADAARQEYKTNAHINRLCEGFLKCLHFLVA